MQITRMHSGQCSPQLQLLTTECQLPMHATTTESGQGQQTSSQDQPKSLHACGSHDIAPRAHEPLSAAHDLCPRVRSPLAFPTSQTQKQSICLELAPVNPDTQPSRMPSTLLFNTPQHDPLIQNTTQPMSAPSYASVLNSVPNLNQNRPTKKIFCGYF